MEVRDVREFMEFARRLTIPYYEQARLFWEQGINDGIFAGANEIKVYTSKFLRELIEEYKEAAAD